MKKQQQLTVADYMHILGLVVLGAGVFLGANYYFMGKLFFSIPLALGILLLLAGIVYVISTLKKAEREQQTKKIAEILILILGYGSVAALSFFFFAHFFNIEFNQKDKIKLELKEGVKNISGIYDEFAVYIKDDIIAPYERKLTTEKREGKRTASVKEDVDNKRKKLNNAFKTRKEVVIELEEQELNNIEQWNPILIPSQANDLPGIIENEENWIKKSIKDPLLTEKPFVFKGKSTNYITSFTQFNPKEINWVLILPIFVILNLIILWPYFATARHRVTNVRTIREDQSKGIKL